MTKSRSSELKPVDFAAQLLGKKLTNHAQTLIKLKIAIVHDTLLSTNDEALKLEKEGQPSGTFIVALSQTLGRGRLKRPWLSSRGNIACSLLLRTEHLPKSHLSLLPLAIALAVRNALATLNIELGLKWPNDIVGEGDIRNPTDYFFHYLKIGGILIESIIKNGELTACVIGIGLNVKASDKIKKANPHAGFLESIRPELRPLEILKALMSELDNGILAFSSDFAEETRRLYSSACVTLGKEVVAIKGSEEIRGAAIGINNDGALIIESAWGKHLIYAGDVSALG